MNGDAIARELRELAHRIRRQARPLAAAAFFVTAFDAGRGVPIAVILGTLYFLGPYGLLIHGSDEPADGSVEPPADGSANQARDLRLIIAILNLPFLAALVLLTGAAAGLALALAVTKAIAWGAPPFRFRDRPGLDVVSSALLVVLPAISGWLVAGGALVELSWTAVLALAFWAVASATLAAIADAPASGGNGAGSIATALGGPATAVIAMVGFVLAAALVATLGPLGALAALGLDLYLLLPAMFLLAARPDAAAEGTAARRAMADARGLHLVVGAWLVVVFVAHWGSTTIRPLEIAIAIAAGAAGWVLLNVVLTGLVTRRRAVPEAAWDAAVPSLTIVIPATDDVAAMAATVGAMRDQTYADATIIAVVDEAAEGEGADLLLEVMGHGGDVVVASPPPAGWVGSNWANQVGAEAATTDLLLFVEGDTYVVPVAIRKLVEQVERGGFALLSAGTASEPGPWPGRVVGAGISLVRVGFFPGWLTALAGRRSRGLATAFAPLVLVRREAYLEVGGHAIAPGSHQSATALARAVAGAGHRVGLIDATDLGTTRVPGSLGAIVGTWRRAMPTGGDGSLAGAVLVTALTVAALIVPIALPFVALANGAEARLIVASCAPLGLLAAARLAQTVTQRQPFSTILYHPLTVVAMLLGQVVAIVDHVRGATAAEPAATVAASLPSDP